MIDWDTLVTGPCMDVFGEAVVFQNPMRVAETITGVFDEAHIPVMPLGDLGNEIGIPAPITEKQPVLGVQLSQFLYPPQQGGTVKLPARLPGRPLPVRYVVQEVEPDGHGWALLKLNLAP